MVSEEELELHLIQKSLALTVHIRTKRTEMQITEVWGGNGCKRDQGGKMIEDLAADQCTGQVKEVFYRVEYTV